MMNRLTRRDFVWLGGVSAFGLTWNNALHGRAAQDGRTARAKRCILVWLDGGPSHLDSWDPKPGAPREVRGPIGTISTSVAGVALSELLPQTAERFHHWALIRSMTSPLGEQNFGTHYLLSGQRPNPALSYPSYGAVYAQHVQHDGAARVLPSHIAIPNFQVGGSNFSAEGFLTDAPRVFEVGGDPGHAEFQVRDLVSPAALTSLRRDRREAFVKQLQHWNDSARADTNAHHPFAQAFRLLASPDARDAFAIEQESAGTRQRYGMKSVGQSCLLARRLVERDVPFVTINHSGWDTHADLVNRLRDGYTGARVPVGLLPSLDQALGALVDDLLASGLWQETFVVVMGEFGRTPKLNPAGGRDHWPRVFSVMCGGAQIAGGQVIGESDSMGESPADRPVTPGDLAATIYAMLGIPPDTILHSPDGRPVPLVSDGTVISELLS
jgi:hypothetical protein